MQHRKKIYLTIIPVLLCALMSAQQTFRIDFMKFSENNDTAGNAKTIFVNRDYFRMDIAGNYSSSIIEDLHSDTLWIILHHSHAYSISTKKPDIPKVLRSKIRTRCYKKDPREIMGYTCYRCEVREKSDGPEKNYTHWYTTKIEGLEIKKNLDFDNIPGIVLESHYKENNTIFRAVSIESVSPDSLFKVPEGYMKF